jgi:hypothetical protein
VWRRTGVPRPVAVVTASDLLARPEADRTGSGPQDEVAIPEGMLADLHYPRLIITDEYVGPDRRTMDRGQRRRQQRDEQWRRTWDPGSDLPPGHPGGASGLRTGQVVAVVLLTAATVAPVTLIVTHLTAG